MRFPISLISTAKFWGGFISRRRKASSRQVWIVCFNVLSCEGGWCTRATQRRRWRSDRPSFRTWRWWTFLFARRSCLLVLKEGRGRRRRWVYWLKGWTVVLAVVGWIGRLSLRSAGDREAFFRGRNSESVGVSRLGASSGADWLAASTKHVINFCPLPSQNCRIRNGWWLFFDRISVVARLVQYWSYQRTVIVDVPCIYYAFVR